MGKWFALVALAIISACSAHRPQADLQVQPQKDYPVTSDPALLVRLEKLSEALENKRKELHIPGMALAVVKDDEIVYTRGFGHADLEGKKPVTPDTLFAIGSSSKAFTSALVGMMVEEGKMAWDDPITKYFPHMKFAHDGDDEAGITIRDMLGHRTGFTRMSLLWVNGQVDRETILKDAVSAESFSGHREDFLYNNVMYLGAGEASAKAAGMNWDQLLESRLLEPLGMNSSTAIYADVQKDPRLSKGYIWNEEKEEYRHLPMRDLGNIAPAGAINSNVLDMSQWLRFQLGKGVFEGKQLIAEEHLLETHKSSNKIAPNFEYGLGWFLQEWEGKQVVQHGGNIDGFGAMVALLPEENLGFVLLTNVTATPLQGLSINMVWDHLLGTDQSEQADTAVAEAISYDEFIGNYNANFATFKDVNFEVLEQNGNLAVNVPGQMIYELKKPNDEGKWMFALTDTIAVSFERNENDEVSLMRMHQGGFNFELPREGFPIKPEIEEKELLKYIGSYKGEGDKQARAVIQNHRLAMDVGQMVFELHLPDEEGHRRFRVRQDRSFVFKENEQGEVVSVTLYRGDEPDDTLMRVDDDESKIPTLEEILELRKTDERVAAIKALGNIHMSGTVRFAQAGVSGTFNLWSDGDQQFKQELDLGKYGWIKEAVSEEGGATAQSFSPFQEHLGKYLEQARKNNPTMLYGDWRKVYKNIDVLANAELDGKTVHKVQLGGGEEVSSTVYLDTETGDVLKQEAEMLVPNVGKIPLTLHFEDFRDVDGVRMPYRYKSESVQSGKTIITIEKIEKGVSLDEDFFVLRDE